MLPEKDLFADLRVECDEVVLRAAQPEDVDALMAVYSDDFDLNPEGRFELASRETIRERLRLRVDLHQQPRTADEWVLELVAELQPGNFLGWALLEADSFTRDRIVESNSWVRTDTRGQGYGTAVRKAALSLAFKGLGANEALSRAEPSNEASARISEKCGYENTGWGRAPLTDGSSVTYSHWTLKKDRWTASGVDANLAGVGAFRSWLDEAARVGDASWSGLA